MAADGYEEPFMLGNNDSCVYYPQTMLAAIKLEIMTPTAGAPNRGSLGRNIYIYIDIYILRR